MEALKAVQVVMARTYFGIFLIVVLLGSDPPAHQVVPHSVGKSKVVIPFGSHIPVLDQREVKMPVKIRLQVCDVLHAGQTSHRNLFLSIMVRQRLRHSGAGCCGSQLRLWKNVNSEISGAHHPGPETQQERHPADRRRVGILKAPRWILSRGWSGLCILGKGWGSYRRSRISIMWKMNSASFPSQIKDDVTGLRYWL